MLGPADIIASSDRNVWLVGGGVLFAATAVLQLARQYRSKVFNPFRYGEGEERGTVPFALVDFWLLFPAMVPWVLAADTFGFRSWATRAIGVPASLNFLVCGVALWVQAPRVVDWLRAGGATVLSSHGSANWRMYALLFVFGGAALLIRGCIWQ